MSKIIWLLISKLALEVELIKTSVNDENQNRYDSDAL